MDGETPEERLASRSWIRANLTAIAKAHVPLALEGSAQSGRLVVNIVEKLATLDGLNVNEKKELSVSFQQPPLFQFDSVEPAASMNDADHN